VRICCVLEKSKRHTKERESYPFLTEDTRRRRGMHTNGATPTSAAPSFLPLPPHTDDPEHQNLFVLLAILQSAPPTAKNQCGVVLLLSCKLLNSTSDELLRLPIH